jgi:hypothetical protein
MGARRRAATLAAALLLTACTGSGLDAQQEALERRTCASLRERVAARALDRFDLVLSAARPDPPGDDKGDDLDPRLLVSAPDRWFATIEQLLDDAPFGAVRRPTSGSPASRLVDTCRALGS